MIVDDEREELRFLTDLLRRQLYHVRTASDGMAGYQAALAAPPDLILLDVRMPGMDGFAACRLLKANPVTRPIPVIFLSALDEPDERVAGLAMGGVDFVAKPYHPAEVFARVRIHLELAGLRRDGPAPAPPPATPHDPDEVVALAAMRLIDDNLAAPLTLAGIARALGTHEKRLSQAFRRHAGSTVFTYLGEARIRRGRQLLGDTGLSVQQVAEQTGFSSAANFATAFREHAGVTPTAYRQALRQQAPQRPDAAPGGQP
nr:response regulator [Duganella sp. 1224]